ncbi:MAG: PaaI family thioesterase [Pseudomonadota bacterium]
MNWKQRLRNQLETAPVKGDDHYAWPREAVPGVIDTCRSAGVAIAGIEVWAIAGKEILAAMPFAAGGTGSFAWCASEHRPALSWKDFAVRSCADAADWLTGIHPEKTVAADFRDKLFYHLSFMEPPEEAPHCALKDSPVSEAADLSGILMAMFGKSPLRQSLDMSIDFDAEGRAVFTLPANPAFFHGMGDVHGGMIMTAMDNAGWFAAAARSRRLVLTADVNIRLLEPARRQAVRAVGRVIRAGLTAVICEMTATTPDGRTIAVGTGSFAITGKKLKIPD